MQLRKFDQIEMKTVCSSNKFKSLNNARSCLQVMMLMSLLVQTVSELLPCFCLDCTLRMILMWVLAVALLTSGAVNGDITGTNPPSGACLCFSENSVNVRATREIK